MVIPAAPVIAVSTIWYVDSAEALAGVRGSEPDAAAARALAGQLHPGSEISETGMGSLAGPAAELMIGCYPGVTVVSAADFTLPHPSQLDSELVRPLAFDQTYLVALDTEHGWGGFAHWERGLLRRAFSATWANIIEDIGLPQVWERPFWAGEHPIPGQLAGLAHALPFYPPALADAANQHWLNFGYLGTGAPDADIQAHGFILDQHSARPAELRAPRGLFRKWLRRKQRPGARVSGGH